MYELHKIKPIYLTKAILPYKNLSYEQKSQEGVDPNNVGAGWWDRDTCNF